MKTLKAKIPVCKGRRLIIIKRQILSFSGKWDLPRRNRKRRELKIHRA
jgi:hypothetical protein